MRSEEEDKGTRAGRLMKRGGRENLRLEGRGREEDKKTLQTDRRQEIQRVGGGR